MFELTSSLDPDHGGGGQAGNTSAKGIPLAAPRQRAATALLQDRLVVDLAGYRSGRLLLGRNRLRICVRLPGGLREGRRFLTKPTCAFRCARLLKLKLDSPNRCARKMKQIATSASSEYFALASYCRRCAPFVFSSSSAPCEPLCSPSWMQQDHFSGRCFYFLSFSTSSGFFLRTRSWITSTSRPPSRSSSFTSAPCQGRGIDPKPLPCTMLDLVCQGKPGPFFCVFLFRVPSLLA